MIYFITLLCTINQTDKPDNNHKPNQESLLPIPGLFVHSSLVDPGPYLDMFQVFVFNIQSRDFRHFI